MARTHPRTGAVFRAIALVRPARARCEPWEWLLSAPGGDRPRTDSGALRTPQRMFTARAASSASVVSEMSDCVIIMSFAHRESTGASVGESAVLVFQARNR